MKIMTFEHPLKKQLESVISLEADMARVRDCLRLLIGPPSQLGGAGLLATALFTQALVSYIRCFGSGRRTWLQPVIFKERPDLAARHEDIRRIRDKHVAHAVNNDMEHVSVVVAVEDDDVPAAAGLGVRYWFFAGFGDDQLREFLELAEFVHARLSQDVTHLGNQLASLVMRDTSKTWVDALQGFESATAYVDPLHGPTVIPAQPRRP